MSPIRWCASSLFCGLLFLCWGAQSELRRVAVTFDDLPGQSGAVPCDLDSLRAGYSRLLGSLDEYGAPAVGFVNEGRLCEEFLPEVLDELLNLWLDAGHDLGNHTFSHRDLNRLTVAGYQQEITRGEPVLKRLLRARRRSLRWFRHPFLHAGDTPEKRQAVLDFLAKRGYWVAPVTIDNQEWMFALAYSRAKRDADQALMGRLVQGYVGHIEASLEFFENYSQQLFGREIPQILLLHANELNMDHVGRVLELLKGRGYAFVSMAKALQDPAYKTPERYAGPKGLSWLLRWGEAKGLSIGGEPREPEWVANLYRNYR